MPKEATGSIVVLDGHLCARIRYTDEFGKRREVRRRVENEKEGRRVLERIRRLLDDGAAKQIDGERMTFGQLADRYQALYVKPAEYANGIKVTGMRSWKTQTQMLGVLKDYFGSRRLNAITVTALEEFAAVRRQTPKVVSIQSPKGPDGQPRPRILKEQGQRSIATVNRELELLRTVLNFAEREGWIARNPFKRGARIIRKAEEAPRERILTDDEQARLLAACVDRCEHLRPILIAALDTAARRGELFQLTWADVDRSRRIIRLTSHKGKRTTFRKVAMTARLALEMDMLWAVSDKQLDTRVFGISDNVAKSWATVCERAEIEGVRFHDLRHTAITVMCRAGISPAEVMKLSGHTQPVTFARYVNTDAETALRVADALDSLLKTRPMKEWM